MLPSISSIQAFQGRSLQESLWPQLLCDNTDDGLVNNVAIELERLLKLSMLNVPETNLCADTVQALASEI